jgi:hypothetical protein
MEMARAWFNIIEPLQQDGRIKDIKQEMANCTLVGEYIGHP